MIPQVTEATLETVREQSNRDYGEYAMNLMSKFEQSQPELMLWLKETARKITDDLKENVDMEEDYSIATHVTIVASYLFLLQAMYAQQEINELIQENIDE